MAPAPTARNDIASTAPQSDRGPCEQAAACCRELAALPPSPFWPANMPPLTAESCESIEANAGRNWILVQQCRESIDNLRTSWSTMSEPRPPACASVVSAGRTIHGVLHMGDPVSATSSGAIHDEFSLAVRAGTPIRILVHSASDAPTTSEAPLELTLALICDGRDVAHDDSARPTPIRQLSYTSPVAANCIVRLTGSEAHSEPYKLQVR